MSFKLEANYDIPYTFFSSCASNVKSMSHFQSWALLAWIKTLWTMFKVRFVEIWHHSEEKKKKKRERKGVGSR